MLFQELGKLGTFGHHMKVRPKNLSEISSIIYFPLLHSNVLAGRLFESWRQSYNPLNNPDNQIVGEFIRNFEINHLIFVDLPLLKFITYY